MKLISKMKEMKNTLTTTKQYVDDELFWDSVCRQIAPATIEEFSDHLMIDEEIRVECLICGIPQMEVDGYPPNLSPHFMDDITELNSMGCIISISTALVPTSITEAKGMLQEAITVNKANQISSKEHDGDVPLGLVLDQQDFQTNFEHIHRRKENLLHSATIITIKARSKKEMRITKSQIIRRLNSNSVLFDKPIHRMLDTFLAAQPFPIFEDFASVEVFSKSAALLLPCRTPNSITDDVGLYFGKDIKTGKNISIDLSKLTAQHLLFIGPTGSGKTFTLLMLLMRAHDLLDKRIFFITNKDDKKTNYRAVPDYYGENGALIDIGPKEESKIKHNINPLQILIDTSIDNNSYAYVRAYNAHKGIVRQFFDIYSEGELTVRMKSKLDEYLDKVYESKGIIREIPSTWKNAEWPTIADLREEFYKDADKDVSAKALYDKTFPFGLKGELGYMSQPTDIDLTANFTVMDLSHVPDLIRNPMNALLIGILGMRFRTDTEKETIIAFDEAGNIMKNAKIADFLIRTITQGRSYGVALWLATQQLIDMSKAGISDEIKTNMVMNIILKTPRDSIELVSGYFKLDEDAQEKLVNCSVGEGLLKVDKEEKNIIHINFKPTEHEMSIITGTKPPSKTATDSVFNLGKSYVQLVIDHKIIFDEWINGDASHVLKDTGYEARSVQNAIGRGTMKCWIPINMIDNNMIGNQSIDHYSTVCQVAGYIESCGLGTKINHYDDVDIEVKDHFALEYERSKSKHSTGKLLEKKTFAEEKHKRVMFFCNADNYNFVKNAVGDENVVPRGLKLKEFLDHEIKKAETSN